MLTHLPGRMSQPSRKGVTSNIFILRCSFHETAKRSSITSLTRLLRLHTKIQSSIVRHNKMSVPVILVILLQTKTEKKYEVSQTFKKNPILSVLWQYSSLTTIQKITDWITSQKPICRRHPINLNNNITDISQKKDLPKALTIQLSIAYLCDTNNKNSEKIFYCSTLDALKTFERHPTQSFNKLIMFS